MLSPAQVRAGRALLNWSQEQLAEESGIAKATIFKIEKGSAQARGNTNDMLERAFILHGVVATRNGGMELQATDIQHYRGREGFAQWYDDIYQTIKNGGDIAVSGCRESDFAAWFTKEQDEEYSARMNALGDKVTCRVILQEGDFDFAYSGYIKYKWIDKAHWDASPLYVYGLKLAMIEFHEDGPLVTVINSPHAARAFRKMFTACWETICRDVPPLRKVTG